MNAERARDCRCPRARHRHGTVAAYKQDGCTCADCTRALRRYSKRLALEAIHGQSRRVDPAPVIARLSELKSSGLSLSGIASVTGLSRPAVSALLSAVPPAYVKASTVHKVIQTPSAQPAPSSLIESFPAMRRLQSLRAAGWTSGIIAERLHTHPAWVARLWRGEIPRIKWSTHAAIIDLWEHLSAQPLPQGASAKRVRTYAAAQGWCPPMAWEPEDFDRPEGSPAHRLLDEVS